MFLLCFSDNWLVSFIFSSFKSFMKNVPIIYKPICSVNLWAGFYLIETTVVKMLSKDFHERGDYVEPDTCGGNF